MLALADDRELLDELANVRLRKRRRARIGSTMTRTSTTTAQSHSGSRHTASSNVRMMGVLEPALDQTARTPPSQPSESGPATEAQ
jgi:hypothetical protein